MSLVEKITRNVMGALNDLVDKTANTGREARQLVRDLGEKISATEQSYIDVKATVTLLTNTRDAAQNDANKWEDNAKKAIKKDDEELARKCLEKKQLYDTKAKGYQNQIDVMKPQVELLSQQLDSLRSKHEEMSNNTDLLEARSESAQAQQKASTIISGITNDNITGEFDRLEKNVAKEEARSQAMVEEANKRSGKDLLAAVEDLDKKDSIDEALAKLKREAA